MRTMQTARQTVGQAPKVAKTRTKKARSKKSKGKEPHRLSNFRLFDLPQELVDMIYTQMLRAGDVNILRTSHQVYARASQLLEGAGVYRMVVHEENYGKLCYHSQDADFKTMYRIQNVELRIVHRRDSTTISSSRSRPQSHLLRQHWQPLGHNEPENLPITRAKVRRCDCRILVQTDLQAGTWNSKTLFDFLRQFTGFKTLSFEYEPTSRRPHQGTPPPLEQPEQVALFANIRHEMEGVMGPGSPIDGDDDVWEGVIFHPSR